MMTGTPLEQRVRGRLAEWEAAGLLRVLRPPAGCDLSSNDYLNLSTHPRIVERFARAVERAGCGSTGSRLLRGDRDVFSALERRFASFKRAGRSLYFSRATMRA
jgi:8-amino-7-oxononanoate synthase